MLSTWDGEQHFPTGAKGCDAQFLQVLVCQSQECLEVNLEAETSQFNINIIIINSYTQKVLSSGVVLVLFSQ